MSPIAAVTAWRARVSPKTEWILVRVADADGHAGWGEATLNGQEDAVIAALRRLAPALIGGDPAPGLLRAAAADPLPVWAASSALDAALCDRAARARDIRVAALLGGVRREQIAVYANINRRTVDRAPAGFAASARAALAAGHTRFKLAPFDGLAPGASTTAAGRTLIDAGIARVAAVRGAVGTRAVMVDCHWRFAPAAVPDLIDRLAEHGVSWLECPVPEDPGSPAGLARLRGEANRRGMMLAGCETQTALSAFTRFLDAGAYDVVMPDVKYVGTLDAMLRIAAHAARARAACAPHNPSGPLCHAASLHVSAAMADFGMLELQFDETPHFDALVGGGLPAAHDGTMALPGGPGLSVAIDDAALARVAPAPEAIA